MKRMKIVLGIVGTSFIGIAQSATPERQYYSITKKNEAKLAPIFVAAFDGDEKAVEEIVKKNKKAAEARDERGNTPLHYAKDLSMVKLLVKYGASVNAQNNDGITRLHHDVIWGDLHDIHFLLEYGANANVKDNNGVTPLHLATMISFFEKPEFKTHALVVSASAAIVAGVLIAASIARPEVADISILAAPFLLAEHAYWIVSRGIGIRNYIVDQLIKSGADPRAQTNDGDTPLHVLASGPILRPGKMHGGVIMAQRLINAGVKTEGPALRSIKNKRGQTPYDVAKENKRLLLLPVLQERKRLIFN